MALNGRRKNGWWARKADKRDDGSDVKEKLLLAPKTVVMKMHHFPRKHHCIGKVKRRRQILRFKDSLNDLKLI